MDNILQSLISCKVSQVKERAFFLNSTTQESMDIFKIDESSRIELIPSTGFIFQDIKAKQNSSHRVIIPLRSLQWDIEKNQEMKV